MKKNTTLDGAVRMANAFETAEKGGEEIHAHCNHKDVLSSNRLNTKAENKKSPKVMKCDGCGNVT